MLSVPANSHNEDFEHFYPSFPPFITIRGRKPLGVAPIRPRQTPTAAETIEEVAAVGSPLSVPASTNTATTTTTSTTTDNRGRFHGDVLPTGTEPWTTSESSEVSPSWTVVVIVEPTTSVPYTDNPSTSTTESSKIEPPMRPRDPARLRRQHYLRRKLAVRQHQQTANQLYHHRLLQ